MTRDDIIAMAYAAGIDIESDTLCRYEGWVEPFQLFAFLVVEAEREACTNTLRELTLDHKSSDYYQGWLDMRDASEAAIKARNQQ